MVMLQKENQISLVTLMMVCRMLEIKFENSKKLFSFIRYNYNILAAFKIKEMYLKSEDGALNNYDVEINDISSLEEDMTNLLDSEVSNNYAKVEKAINKNIQRGLLLDLWLKLPENLKINYDVNDEYSDMYFRIYDDEEIIVIKTISVKKSKDSPFMPTQKFDTYLMQLYQEWKNNV